MRNYPENKKAPVLAGAFLFSVIMLLFQCLNSSKIPQLMATYKMEVFDLKQNSGGTAGNPFFNMASH